MVQPVITSPVKHNHPTILQTQSNPSSPANIIESQNLTQLPRVFTLEARYVAPPGVPERVRNISPRNLFHKYLFNMVSANQAIDFGENHWTNMTMINYVLHPVTVKEIQYKDLMNHPVLGPLYKIGLGNELGSLLQVIRDIKGTNTCFFIDLVEITKDRKIAYGKLVYGFKPHKVARVRLTVGGNILD